MARIKDTYIGDLKARVPILDVVSTHVKLKRSGKSWVGLSPFSQEKTPSFYVHPEKDMFHCFSTNTGGDAIRFVQLVENLTFVEALETLAHRFNFPVQYEHGSSSEARQSASMRTELFKIHEDAATWYREHFLAKNKDGEYIRDYWINQRNFSLDTAEDFKVGFAPAQGGLRKLLEQKKYARKAIEESGLFFAGGTERFRGRLMIPIRDTQGRIAGFTARQLEVTPTNDPAHKAKYVNSPDTPIFRKGNLLFNLDNARVQLEEQKSFLLVEGQLDAMRCWEVGAKTVVATQGTALSEVQAKMLARHQAESLEVLLDGDTAGRGAALRILPILLEAGLETTFLELPEGEDPDDFMSKGGIAALEQLRADAKTTMPFVVETLLDGQTEVSPERQRKILEKIFDILSSCSSSTTTQEAYLRQAGALLNISEDAAKQDFSKFRSRQSYRSLARAGNTQNEQNRSQKLTTVEYDLLFFALHHEQVAHALTEVINLEWIKEDNTEGALASRIFNDIQAGIWEKDLLDSLLTSEDERTMVAQVMTMEGFQFPWDTANECLAKLFRGYIEQQEKKIKLQLANLNNDDLDVRKELQSELRKVRIAGGNPPKISPLDHFNGHNENETDEDQAAFEQTSNDLNKSEKAEGENISSGKDLVFGFE